MGVEYYPLDVAVKDGNVVLQCTQNNLEKLIKDDTLVIPGIITEIEEGTFNGINVKKIVIPGSVKTIGRNAFSNNKVLEEIEIQDGVKTIGNSAFYGCSNLGKVTMTDSVTTLRCICVFWM